MLNSKWRKAIRDLSLNKMRSFLVILAIIIGVFGISVVANSYSILTREMNKNYMDTNPASATLTTDYLDSTVLENIKKYPDIQEVERRDKIVGRVQIGENEWKDIWLFVVDDFDNVRLDTFTPEEGKAIPADGEILFERKALTFTEGKIGQSINIRIPDGITTTLKLSGTVYAPGLAPAWMEGLAYGFITHDTYLQLGGKDTFSDVKILVKGDTMDKKYIRETAYSLKDYLSQNGIGVYRIDIPDPGRHPHYTQMATLLYLMEVFGLITLILSGVLVANMITSIMEQQTRQIGIMKAVGAGTGQITLLYQGIVLFSSLIALLIGIPIGIYAGRGVSWLVAEILNFKISSYHIPAYIFLLEIAVGLLIPILVSFIPIRKASKVTVREALQDYGIKQEKYSGKGSEKTSSLLRHLPRPFLLSLRNTFRRKGRLLFTLMVMAIGGCGFIVAMNIYSSMYNTVDKKMDSMAYDIQVTLEQPYQIDEVEKVIKGVTGVTNCEAWGGAGASVVYNDGTMGNGFSLVAPPSSTKLMTTPPLYAGRWLKPEDTNSIVVNQKLLSAEPGIHIGDEIILRINGKDTSWKIIGVSKELIGFPTAYANQEYLSKLLGMEGYAKNVVIVTSEHTSAAQAEEARLLEQVLQNNDMPIMSLTKLVDFRQSLTDHLTVIASFLVFMSLLIVIVGGLGLATTISINTMERTREIGIMRATGASANYITRIIVAEGSIIGVLSWCISSILSIPLSSMISYRFGMTFFDAPLEFAASVSGYIIWLVLVVIFAMAACYYPSKKASRMQVKDALSYE